MSHGYRAVGWNRQKKLYDRALASGVVLYLALFMAVGLAVHPTAGVETLVDLPVGENIQDHLEVYFQYRCQQPITLNGKLNMLSKGMIGAEWVLFKSGLGATNHFESCAFIRSRAGLKWPNLQYHFLPAATNRNTFG